jgi:PAS domain S-box-containing protein
MNSQRLPAQPSALRLEAEARLNLLPSHPSDHSTESLMHELQVHEIELEMQNEQLQHIQLALAESRDRYFFLYESAPIAYLTLDVSGRIAEANRIAATLFDESYAELLHSHFAQRIAAEDLAHWNENFDLVLKHEGQQECTLKMRRGNGSFFTGHLLYLFVKNGVAPELHVALADVTAQKDTERARWMLEARLSRLTRRERDVLAWAMAGLPNKTISVRLGINQRTVENHRARIYKKTGVDSLLELAQQATAAGVSLDAISELLARP